MKGNGVKLTMLESEKSVGKMKKVTATLRSPAF